jgi:hypothetical protein
VHAIPESRPFERGAPRSIAFAAYTPALVGSALVVIAFAVYLLCNRSFNAGRGDFFYLADAFLHGRTWLTGSLGPNDDVLIGNRVYVPFAPFPAILVLPLVALVGPETADTWQPIVNAGLAALDIGLVWILLARIGVERLWHRVAIAILFGFSTQIWWVTTRGGVWHTGHLVASALTLLALIELFGARRMLLVGLLGGGAFLTRAPVLFAMPFFALWSFVGETVPGRFDARFDRFASVAATVGERAAATRKAAANGAASLRTRVSVWPFRESFLLSLGFVPALLFYLWYNAVRFGSPLESGYGLATLPGFLEAQRQLGLFSIAHLGMNIDYLFLHTPRQISTFPFFRPDGLGMSIFLTSPGLLYALRAPWRDRRTWLLAGAFVFTLIPSLLYYGGGWLQYGYRYALDSIPFAIALCGMAVASRRGIGIGWLVLIAFGVVVNAAGVYWAYHL